MTTDKTPATMAVDVLAVLRRHAESHRASAGSDAYSAQEAPRLEGAIAAVAEMIEAMQKAKDDLAHQRMFGVDSLNAWRQHATLVEGDIEEALARVKGESA